jgi:HlyD family secretion protein
VNEIDLSKLKVDRQASAAPKLIQRSRLRWWHAVPVLLLGLLAWRLVFPAPVLVQTTQVVSAWPSQQYLMLDATGYVVARRKAAVASKGTGRVEWLGASEGDHVKAGTVVARLESSDVSAGYQAAAANSDVAASAVGSALTELNDADVNLQRVSILYNKGLVAQMNLREAMSRFSRAKSAVTSARASLAAARANQDNARSAVNNTEIRAPFDGVVIARSANVGDIVTPLSSAADAKGAVMVMADMSTLEINADVSESSLSSIRVGQPCEITLDAFANRRFRGEVSAIVPTINRASATVTTKIRIFDATAGILPDMSARVSFLSQAVPASAQKAVLAVDPKAIRGSESGNEVAVISTDLSVQIRKVVLGATLGDVVAVRGALKAGDVLVLSPSEKLASGDRVTVAELK